MAAVVWSEFREKGLEHDGSAGVDSDPLAGLTQ